MVLLVDASQAQIDGAIASGALPQGTTSAGVYGNASSIRSYGLNADWDASALGQRLRYGAGLSVARSRRDDTILLEAAAQVFGNARVSYDLGGRLPTLALAGRFVEPRPLSGSAATPIPDGPRLIELHGAVSGPIRGGVSYRLAGTWSSTESTAYAVGPSRELPSEVLPAPRFQVLLGLRYDTRP
jgi:hypothetical protein